MSLFLGSYLVPVVAHSVCKDGSSTVETCRGNGASDLGEGLELLARILVPESEPSICACGREGTVDWVPVDAVDSVYRCLVSQCLTSITVALERKVHPKVYNKTNKQNW